MLCNFCLLFISEDLFHPLVAYTRKYPPSFLPFFFFLHKDPCPTVQHTFIYIPMSLRGVFAILAIFCYILRLTLDQDFCVSSLFILPVCVVLTHYFVFVYRLLIPLGPFSLYLASSGVKLQTCVRCQ